MKTKMISIFLLVCISVLMISSTVMAAEEDVDEGGIVDALPEIVVAVIGIAGLIVLVTSTKDVGGALGKGFNFVKIGYALFALDFIILAAAEMMGFEDSIELAFEVLALLGMLLIVYGPKKIADTLKQT